MAKQTSRILIIDDDKQICAILSDLVKGEGFEATVAYEGEKALKIVRSAAPDLLLVDMMLPGMDGMEVLRQVKDLDPELPVVFITGHADARGAVKAIKAGAHDYLSKPFDNQDVIRVVHRALAERELKLKVRRLSSQVSNVPLKGKMGPSDAVEPPYFGSEPGGRIGFHGDHHRGDRVRERGCGPCDSRSQLSTYGALYPGGLRGHTRDASGERALRP